jgi:hypothetical protein
MVISTTERADGWYSSNNAKGYENVKRNLAYDFHRNITSESDWDLTTGLLYSRTVIITQAETFSSPNPSYSQIISVLPTNAFLRTAEKMSET